MGLKEIYCDPRFWRLAPISALCIGSSWALQGLWAGPWLTDVEGLDRHAVVGHLFAMALGLCGSALLFGVGAECLRRRGVSLSQSFAGAAALALVAQLALVLRWPLPAWLPWVVIGAVGTATVLSYAILSELYPSTASGRANGALNVLHVSTAFVLQIAIGLVVQIWPADAGHYPTSAYQVALGLNLALQVVAFAWFVRPHRQTAAAQLSAHPVHTLAARFAITPATAMSYARAREFWIVRLEDAYAQRQDWRKVGIASFAVLALLGLSLGTTVSSQSVAAHMTVASGRADRAGERIAEGPHTSLVAAPKELSATPRNRTFNP